MKKLVFSLLMLSVVLSMTLTSCSCFNSDPIEPKILGTGSCLYDDVNGLYFVDVDSNRYIITDVVVSRTQNVKPVAGMTVTVFVSSRQAGVQAVTGIRTVEDIEAIYRKNETYLVVILFLFFICIIGIGASRKRELPVVDADR